VTSLSRSCEADRIVREYARRASEIPSDFYALDKPANLFIHQQRSRRVLSLLAGIGLLPLRGKRALEVGCGAGGWLPELESWGVRRSDLAGIDLDPGRIETARTFLCARRDETGRVLSHGADIQCGDAASLPWPASRFDLVIVSTVFSSILDHEMRRDVAAEILRVLRPEGVVVWYDFFVDNPRNPNVRGVDRRQIRALFHGCDVGLSRVTLAPPLARRIVPISWGAAMAIEACRLLNTHYLGVIRKK